MKYPLLLVGVFVLSSCTLSLSSPEIQNTWSGSAEFLSISWKILSTEHSSGSTSSGGAYSGNTSTGNLSTKHTHICTQDICIDPEKPFFLDGEDKVQIMLSWVDGQSTRYISQNLEKFPEGWYILPEGAATATITKINTKTGDASRETTEEMFGEKTLYTNIIPRITTKVTRTTGCSYGYREEFFDNKGKALLDPSSYIPSELRSLRIGNMVLALDWSQAQKNHMFGFKFAGQDNPGKLETVSLKWNYKEEILRQIKDRSHEGTFLYYVLEFQEYPEVLFYYKNSLWTSEAIISIPLASTDIDAKGNVINPEKTRQILSLYSGDYGERKIWRSIRKKWDETNYNGLTLTDFSGKTITVLFQVKRLDEQSVLLNPAEGYEGFTTAELCKPLVYIYDSFKRQNSLSVNFPKGGAFTKLIPQFSHGNTWNFQANKDGQLSVEGTSSPYSYLYYSARVPDYTYNAKGWQVYGKDIGAFFEEKLDTIGFNATEKKDFIEYWIPEFHPDTLYFVSFKFDEALDEYITLNLEKKPASQMRVLLEAYPIKEISRQFLWPNVGKKLDDTLLKRFVRSGDLDVFEWGWTVQKIQNGQIVIH